MPRQKDNDKERPKYTRKPKVNEFVEKEQVDNFEKTQEETPEIVFDEEEETQQDEDYEIQDVDEQDDLNDEQDDLFEEKEEKHGYLLLIKFKNVNEKDKVTIHTNFMSKVMAREIDELLTSVTLVLDFLHMVNEKKEATFTLKSEKTYVVILCTIYNFFRTLSKSNITILGSFTTRTLKDLIIFIKSLNNVELATFIDTFNTFKNILILIKFIKGTKKLKYLNTDKLDIDDEVQIAIFIKQETFDAVTKEILLHYFEIEAKELFGNYYIDKGKIAKVGLKAEDKYLVKDITFYNNCEKIKEMELGGKTELEIHPMYLFKRIGSTSVITTSFIQKPPVIKKSVTLEAIQQQEITEYSSKASSFSNNSLETNSIQKQLFEFLRNDFHFEEKNLNKVLNILEVASFYKKSYELLKEKYEKVVSIIESFNELYSDIVNWQTKNSKQVNKISKEFTMKKETDVVERSYYCRFISGRVCDINKEGMDYLLNEKNIYNRFIFIAKKLFPGDSLISILDFNKLSTAQKEEVYNVAYEIEVRYEGLQLKKEIYFKRKRKNLNEQLRKMFKYSEEDK
ncbi:hypothetical protein ABK040_016122 [Willaertia magna]